MSKTRPVITCDACGNDLTSSGNMEDYRIVLGNESVPSRGGVVTCMGAYPALKDGDKHFCEIECLRKWFDENYPPGKRYHGGKCWAAHMRKERAAGKDPQYS
jgi:hypothetical protein